VCLINEVYDYTQGVHYSLIDGKCVEAGGADVSYVYECPCEECQQFRDYVDEND